MIHINKDSFGFIYIIKYLLRLAGFVVGVAAVEYGTTKVV